MALDPGTKLGTYEIGESLGVGGMGEVYRAVDSRLRREVAIKVLPDVFAEDEERLARFEREAHLLASLNHPNIAAIYGVEESEGHKCLVLELVEGETLAEKITAGALPIEEALRTGLQIASALETAHDKGVIHRDLKPANVKVAPDGTVKVLDFGLAKALDDEAAGSDPDLTRSPTLTMAATRAGVILGTASYMSPEQAKAKSVDKRTDIWAFGVVLFEMLVGRSTFSGENVSEILAEVIKIDPDWEKLPANTPRSVRKLLERCLQKDPTRRLRDIGEARLSLEEALAGGLDDVAGEATPGLSKGMSLGLLLTGLLLGAIASALIVRSMQPGGSSALFKSDLVISDVAHIVGEERSIIISPDGTKVAWVVEGGLHVRDLGRVEPRVIQTDGNPAFLFWSPDSQWIGYASAGSLWKVPPTGGESTLITNLNGPLIGGRGAAWGVGGDIVYSRGGTGLFQVSARGGDIRTFVELNIETEGDLHEPYWLPEDRGVLFVTHLSSIPPGRLEVISSDGERKVLLDYPGETIWEPVYANTGHIIFRREPTNAGLWAVPFSLADLEVSGEPFILAPEGGQASASSDGTLVYLRNAGSRDLQLVWVNRQGQISEPVGQEQEGIIFPTLSPDGSKVALSANEGENRDIWIQDLSRGTKTRFTFDQGTEWLAVWAPGDDVILYNQQQTPDNVLYAKKSDGTGDGTLYLDSASMPHFTPDGEYMAFHRKTERGDRDVWFKKKGDDEPTPLLQSEGNERTVRISPDGNWLAYNSDESGQPEIYITRFPSGEGKWQASVDGGTWPVWNPRGDELFYVQRESLMSVPVQTEPQLTMGTPAVLFNGSSQGLQMGGARWYDIHPDGERFIWIANIGNRDSEAKVTVVQNWFAEFAEGN